MAELGLISRACVGPLSGAALFVILTGGRLPRGRPRLPGGALAARCALLATSAGLEEVVWRAILLGGLARAIGSPAALVVSSVVFAAWHWRALGRGCAVHLVTGVGFGAAFLVGGLPAAIVSHAAYNILVDWAVRAERARRHGR